MRRIYDVEFEHNICFTDERIKRNTSYAISSRFLTEPLFRNLYELDLSDYVDLVDVIGVNIIGIVLVLRNNKCFLMYRKVNPYA